MPIGVVPLARCGHLSGGEPEQEHVFLAGFLRHFDRGSVARSDGQRAVHHELHVAGAAGFVARGRDLLGNIARRNQAFGNRHAVIGQKDDLQLSLAGRVLVDHGGEIVNELDDELGQMISGRGFPGEEKRARRSFRIGILAQTIVKDHDMERVQQLPLVLVNALDLAVEDAVGVGGFAGGGAHPVEEAQLRGAFGFPESRAELRIVGQRLQARDLA